MCLLLLSKSKIVCPAFPQNIHQWALFIPPGSCLFHLFIYLSAFCFAGFIQLQSPSSLLFTQCLVHLISHFTFIVFSHTYFDHKFLLANSVLANGCTSEKASPKDLPPRTPPFIFQDGFLSCFATSVSALKTLPPKQPPLPQVNKSLVHHIWISDHERKSPIITIKGKDNSPGQKNNSNLSSCVFSNTVARTGNTPPVRNSEKRCAMGWRIEGRWWFLPL